MSAVVDLHDVTVRRGDKLILRDVDWRVERGEHWAVIGPNGSGKTTLLSIVNGYLWPTLGTVEVLGERFGRTDLHALRRSIGWVSSAFGDRIHRFSPRDRALDVVLSGRFASIGVYERPSAEERERASELLERFGCGQLAGERFAVLSQGERQRVLLARAWMAEPKLLVLDEPCGGLDLPARERLLDAVALLGARDGGPTLLYVTHRVEEVLPTFTHALLLREGRVVAAGPRTDVLTGAALSAAFGIGLDVDWRGERPWVSVS